MARLLIAVDDGCRWALFCNCVRLLSVAARIDLVLPIIFDLPYGWLNQAQQSLYRILHTISADVAVFSERSPSLVTLGPVFVLSDAPVWRVASDEPARITGFAEFARRVLTEEGRTRLNRAVAELALNAQRLFSLRNVHFGRRAFIIGNGPSLRTMHLPALSGEITFGFNAIFLVEQSCDFRPTYYVVEDHLIAEDRQVEINGYAVPMKFFPCDQADRLHGGVYLPWATHYNDYPRFSEDACSVVFSGWTVTYVALQLAWYMGIRDIILIGVDGTYQPGPAMVSGGVMTSTGADTNHFHPDYYGPGHRFHPPNRDRVFAAHTLAAAHAAACGGSIRNATPGTELTAYKAVSFDALLRGEA